jgi:hypothetical protein
VAQEALTPRDAFWSASDLIEVAPNPAVPIKVQPNPIVETAPKRQKAVPIGPHIVATKGYGVEPRIIKFPVAAQRPLGLRYALLKVGDDDQLIEVLPETTFRSGDRVKISVMANQPGYIYIIEQGSSGSWKPLFPAQGALPESNRVEAGRIYQMPAGKSFVFNQQTGQERLFILLNRQIVSDLDGLIFSLERQQLDATKSTPSNRVEASNSISNELVQQLKSRDLTEVVDPPQETKDASFGENAMYVVSQGKGSAPPSQVFADLVLDHR